MQQHPLLFQRLNEVDWKGVPPTRQIKALERSGATHVADLLLVEDRAGPTMGSSRVCYVRDRPDELREPSYEAKHGDIQRTNRLSRVRVRGMGPNGHQELRAMFSERLGLDLDQVAPDSFLWERLAA